MTKVAIVLNSDGTFESVHCNEELDVSVLQRGKDDDKIDSVEVVMEEVEI
jgi:hypothetical protein